MRRTCGQHMVSNLAAIAHVRGALAVMIEGRNLGGPQRMVCQSPPRRRKPPADVGLRGMGHRSRKHQWTRNSLRCGTRDRYSEWTMHEFSAVDVSDPLRARPALCPADVGYAGQTGRDMLPVSPSYFDPKRSSQGGQDGVHRMSRPSSRSETESTMDSIAIMP